MNPAAVLLEVTEAALHSLHETHADFLRTSSPSTVGRFTSAGGHARLRWQGGPEVRTQGTYLRLVSIVEAFLDSLSSELFLERVSDVDNMFRNLIRDAEEKSDNSWENRKHAFRDYHQVSLGDCTSWSQIDCAIVVRNAIAHGLGSLTRRQKNRKDRQKVREAKVSLIDDVIHVDEGSLLSLLKASDAFIRDVDSRIRAR